MNKLFSTLTGVSVLATGVTWATSFAPANAFNVVNQGVPTTGGSGFPSGQSTYAVTGLNENDVFDVFWNVPTGTQGQNPNRRLPTALNAQARFTVIAIDNGSIRLGVNLTNTTTAAPNNPNYRLSLTALGLTTGNNNVTSASYQTQGTKFDGIRTNNFASFATDVCAFAANNCAGAGNVNNTLNPGQSDSFVAILNGNFTNNTPLTLDTFAVKWQTGAGSFETAGTPVPEPITLLGSGIALGFGAYLKRKADKQKVKL